MSKHTALVRRNFTAVEEFDPARVRPLPGQPRKRFRGIDELAESMREVGQLCPGQVTLIEGDKHFDAQLVDGERRLTACRKAGIPFRAEVRPSADAEEIFAQSFAANFGKQDHDAIEIAEALGRLSRAGRSREQLARLAGKSVGWVDQHMNLLRLHPDVQAMIVVGEDGDEDKPRLPFTVAHLLVPLPPKVQIDLARKIVKQGMSMSASRRTVMKLRGEVGDRHHSQTQPRRVVASLNSIVSNLRDRLGVYMDMPGSEFGAILDGMKSRDKAMLLDALEESAESLQGLADAIKSRLVKGRAA